MVVFVTNAPEHRPSEIGKYTIMGLPNGSFHGPIQCHCGGISGRTDEFYEYKGVLKWALVRKHSRTIDCGELRCSDPCGGSKREGVQPSCFSFL